MLGLKPLKRQDLLENGTNWTMVFPTGAKISEKINMGSGAF